MIVWQQLELAFFVRSSNMLRTFLFLYGRLVSMALCIIKDSTKQTIFVLICRMINYGVKNE